MTPLVRQPSSAPEALEHDDDRYNNPQRSRPTRPLASSSRNQASPAVATATGTHSRNTASASSSNVNSSSLPLNLHLLIPSWNKVEAMQRWVLEKTLLLEYIPHPLYHRHHHSATVQRVLKDAELQELELRYKEQIKADEDIQGLQKQIYSMRQQLQHERRERERLEKKQAAARERDQKTLDAQLLKLKQALHESNTATKNRRDYSKALQRAGQRKQKRNSSNSLYSKLSQPITSVIATTISAATSMSSSSSSSKTEKEAQALETTILRHMCHTMLYQNQCDVAQKYSSELMSSMKRSRAQVHEENAQIAMIQMVMEGTCHALAEMYPEIISRQEALIHRMRKTPAVVPRRSIPRIIVPTCNYHPHKRSSFSSNNSPQNYSISDLGESVETDSTKEDVVQLPPRRGRYPVFTSVEVLQQQTLQNLAGVRM